MVEYYVDSMRQNTSFMLNSVKTYNFAVIYNCTTVGRAEY